MPEPTDNEAWRQEIAGRAYLRFCDRGCVHGSDTEDWLTAELEVMAEREKATDMSKTPEPLSRRRTTRGRR